MTRRFSLLSVLLVASATLSAYDYRGPKPPKEDIPFLVHADNLVPTESGDAKSEKVKRGVLYFVPGAASQARTPLAEPIFVIDAKRLAPEKLSVYAFKITNGRRELLIPERAKDAPRPFKKTIKRLRNGLVIYEVAETLPPGEYALSPDGSDAVYCFQVY